MVDKADLPDDELVRHAAALGELLRRRGQMLAVAESCTGGLIAAAITAVPGSSQWFERGFVTYANRAKEEMLGVAAQTLEAHGAVSEAVAREMAAGALRRSHAQVSLAVSGIAGPGGAVPGKPVGMVCFAWDGQGVAARACTLRFAGGRHQVRRRAALAALQGMASLIGRGDGDA